MTIGITLDCQDVALVAAFWREAIGYEEPTAVDPSEPFHVLVTPGGGLHCLTLQRVPEAKSGKNRVHLDLLVDDLGVEVARLVARGATVLAEHVAGGGYRTAVLGDPEMNEFCVVQRTGSPTA